MSKARILVVEDESIAALFEREILERAGYEVTGVVKYGEEAIEKAGQSHPDLVLMDINLKGEMNGIEAAGIIYKRYGIPSIFVTAYSHKEVTSIFRVQGIVDTMQKPLQEEEVKNRIESVLKLRIEKR